MYSFCRIWIYIYLWKIHIRLMKYPIAEFGRCAEQGLQSGLEVWADGCHAQADHQHHLQVPHFVNLKVKVISTWVNVCWFAVPDMLIVQKTFVESFSFGLPLNWATRPRPDLIEMPFCCQKFRRFLGRVKAWLFRGMPPCLHGSFPTDLARMKTHGYIIGTRAYHTLLILPSEFLTVLKPGLVSLISPTT